MQTRSYWRSNNLSYRDADYSPAQGVSIWELAPQLASFDPSVGFSFFDDFFEYVELSSNQEGWIKTAVGVATLTSDDAVGGVLKIVNAAADNDSVELQWNAENFKLATGKPLWFETRLQVSDATQSDLIVGLCITDTTLIAGMTDGVYFRKDDGDANIDVVTEKNSTETATDSTSDITADTYVKLGFYFDGAGNVDFYVDGVLKKSHTANIPDDEELAVSIAFQNGEAVAKTAKVDYVKVLQIR